MRKKDPLKNTKNFFYYILYYENCAKILGHMRHCPTIITTVSLIILVKLLEAAHTLDTVLAREVNIALLILYLLVKCI